MTESLETLARAPRSTEVPDRDPLRAPRQRPQPLRRFCSAGPAEMLIAPGTPHRIRNESADVPLVLLCACAPAYSYEDTQLLE
jgi:hypothetical protein